MCIRDRDYQRVYAGINLDAVMHNLEKMHTLIKDDTKIIAVIKTDGYGHGAVPIAKKIESLPYLWGFAVATQQMCIRDREHSENVENLTTIRHYQTLRIS